jgi:hypothetical protein
MKLTPVCAVTLACVFLFALTPTAVSQTWTPLVNPAPVSVGAMLLLTDGRVLVHEEPNCSGTGCVGNSYSNWYTLTPDITGSYINGTWTEVAALPSGYEPLFFSSAVLPDGNVAIQGGEYNCPSGNCTGDWQSQGALYDPLTNTWTALTPEISNTAEADGDAQSVVLPNGTWMTAACCAKVSGVTTYADYFYFNESSLNFTSEASASDGETTEFDESGWNLMPNGEVLMVNVYLGSYSASAKGYAIYNPSTNTWTEYTSTAVQLWDDGCGSSSKASYELGPVMLMPNGTFFATGASECEAANLATYNWSTNTWTAQGTFPGKGAANDAPGATEINGNAIVMSSPYTKTFSAPSTFYEWNGTTLSTFPNPSNVANDASYVGHLLVLPTGQIMFTDFTTGVEILTSAGTYQSAWQPTITTAPYSLTAGQTYSISGTQFNGVSTGAAYGDDFQDNTNYPLVRIVNNATGNVYYARTHGHSTMGVATGTTTVSTNFDVPADMPSGACELYVVGNGIPSAASACNVGPSTINTTTTVASSANPSAYGQTVTFTATVTPDSSPIATGTVQFTAGGVTINGCSGVTLSSGGTAQCSTSALAVGTTAIVAIYSGDTNYSGSSGTLSEVVNAAASSTVVTSGTNPSVYGQSVTFTATISGEYGQITGRSSKGGARAQNVTGSVTWSSNTGCGSTAVTSGNPGVATCTTTSLPAGNNTITATYSGDGNHGVSAGSVSQTVNQASTSISVTSVSPAAEDYGADAPVTITAVLSWTGSGVAPTAADVTISGNGHGTYGSTSCGTASGNTITCTATYTPTSSDLEGFYTESAAFSGDGNYTSSSSAQTNNFTISQASAATVVTSNLNPSAFGQSVTFTATISGQNGAVKGATRKNGTKGQTVTGTVSWSSNTGCGTTSVTAGNPGVATCTTTSVPVGSDTITATYSGDSNHGGSSGNLNQTVNATSTSINVTSVSPAAEDYGADTPVTITALLSWTGSGTAPKASNVTIGGNGPSSYGPTSCGSASGDTLTCTATYTPTTADSAGSYNETASFSADGNYSASSSTQSGNFTINGATSSTVVTSSVNPAALGQSVMFTATISGENGAVKGRTTRRNGAKSQDVTGTVAWSQNTGCGTTSVTAGSPGLATCTTTTLPQGSDTVTASYSGDSNHGGSTGSLVETINSSSQTITFTTNAPANAAYNTSFVVAATASSGLPVTFTSSGVCSNVGATYTMISGTGTCSVIANQAGNSQYGAAPTVTETTNATLAANTVTFTANAPTSAVYNSQFTVAASGKGTGAVSYGSVGACSNSGATFTMTSGTGTCSETATQAADSNYASASASENTTATPASQTITVTTPAPPTATLNSSFTIVATASSGLPVTFGSSGGCTNSGETYTMASTGKAACTETMNVAANNNYTAAPTVTESTTVAAAIAPTVSFTGAPTTAPYQSTFPVTATTNAGVAATITATGSCTVSGTTVTISSGTGLCSLTATWPATDVYKSAKATQKTTAEKIAPTVSFTGAPSSAAYLSTFTPATTENSGVTPKITSTPASVCTISSGVVTMKNGTGTCTVEASWATNAYYLAATLEQSTTATTLGTTTTITNTVPETNPLKVTVYFAVSNGTSTAVVGDVTVTAAPGGQSCTGTAASGKCILTFTAAGSQTLTAVYAGNSNNATSTSAGYPLMVQ